MTPKKKLTPAPFRKKGTMMAFSRKQLRLMTWWCRQSVDSSLDGVICDGAVRSGKTYCMSLSFILWSMQQFQGENFALCGKTISSLRRNVISPLLGLLPGMGFDCAEKLSRNYLDISFQGRKNRYYLFSGKDESSAALIQGITLAGVLFDEVALMAHSFVEQAVARCSVEKSKFWFNCNPEHPRHWFYTQWICKCKEKNLLYLHFVMADNPALSATVRKRYESIYSGGFYQRFILGKWVSPQGSVYPMFSREKHVVQQCPPCKEYRISCDYGTVNPCSMGLWGEKEGVWYRMAEYYHDSRESGKLKTDEEYYAALQELADGRKIECIVVDPSAASFLACIRRHAEYPVIPAQNQVMDGIRMVSEQLREEKIMFHASCEDTLREFQLYHWDEKATRDQPIKENDHAMDDIRYFVMSIAKEQKKQGFFAYSIPRKMG